MFETEKATPEKATPEKTATRYVLPFWKVYFYFGVRVVTVKTVSAENEAMAIMIAKAIADHDRDEWRVNIEYNSVECSLPYYAEQK